MIFMRDGKVQKIDNNGNVAYDFVILGRNIGYYLYILPYAFKYRFK